MVYRFEASQRLFGCDREDLGSGLKRGKVGSRLRHSALTGHETFSTIIITITLTITIMIMAGQAFSLNPKP